MLVKAHLTHAATHPLTDAVGSSPPESLTKACATSALRNDALVTTRSPTTTTSNNV